MKNVKRNTEWEFNVSKILTTYSFYSGIKKVYYVIITEEKVGSHEHFANM